MQTSNSMIAILRSGLVGCLACVVLSVSAENTPFAPTKKDMPVLPMQTTSAVLGHKMYGEMQYMSAYSSTVTDAGAESPYSDGSENQGNGVRRVSPGGGIGEPGAIEPTPIGDVPMAAVLLALGGYALWVKRRQKKA